MNSSPQTTELFAAERQRSLMYWVALGAAVGVGGGAVASVVSQRIWPLLATVTVSAGMLVLYRHACARGTRPQLLELVDDGDED